MCYFDDIELNRLEELPKVKVEAEAAKRLFYALKACATNKALAISDKGEGLWVAVNAEWIDLVGWTIDDMNEAVENPFHPDDFESLLLVHSTNNLAAPYRIRIRKKGQENYEWYKMDSFSMSIENHIFRFCILEEAE